MNWTHPNFPGLITAGVFALLASFSMLAAQENRPLAALTYAEMGKLLAATPAGEGRQALWTQVLASRRLDLAELCFADPSAGADFPVVVGQEQDQNWQHEMILVLLRTESPFWATTPSLPPGAEVMKPFQAAYKFASPSTTYVPEAPAFASPEFRASFAQNLELRLRHPARFAEGQARLRAAALHSAKKKGSPPAPPPVQAPAPSLEDQEKWANRADKRTEVLGRLHQDNKLVGMRLTELEALIGPGRNLTPLQVVYLNDTGFGGTEWTLRVIDGVITTVRMAGLD